MTVMSAFARLTAMLICSAVVTSLPLLAKADSGAWTLSSNTDQLSGRTIRSASRIFTFDHGLRVRSTASCASGIVNFDFRVFGSGGDGLPLAWQRSETYSGVTFGFSTLLTRNVSRWVPLQVRVGQGPVTQRNSSSKFTNEAEIVFYDPQELQAAIEAQEATLRSRQGGRPHSAAEALGSLNNIMGAVAMAGLPGLMPMVAAGTFADLRAAGDFRVELPLADGRAPVVVVTPSAPGLQSFLNGCDSTSATASFEGVFSGPGVQLVLHNGIIVAVRGGRQSPPATYHRSGDRLLVTDPDHETHEFDITPDGGLSISNGRQVMRFTRQR